MGLDKGRRRSVVSNGTSVYLDGLTMDIFVSAGMVRASLVECGPRRSSVVAVEVGYGCGCSWVCLGRVVEWRTLGTVLTSTGVPSYQGV